MVKTPISLNEKAKAKELSLIQHRGNLYLVGKDFLIPVRDEAEANELKKKILEGESKI